MISPIMHIRFLGMKKILTMNSLPELWKATALAAGAAAGRRQSPGGQAGPGRTRRGGRVGRPRRTRSRG